MSKVKIRCASCGKWFQSANAKDTMCHDCVQKAKKEKQAAKATPTVAVRPSFQRPAPVPSKPKQEKSGTSQWLDAVSDVKVGQPEQPAHPKPFSPPRENRSGDNTSARPNSPREPYNSGTNVVSNPTTASYPRDRENRGNREGREGGYRGPGSYRENEYRTPYRVGGGNGLPDGQRPRQPMENRRPRPDRGNRPNFRDGKPKVKAPKPPPPPKREKIPPPQPFVPTPEQITQVQTRYIELAQPEFDGIRTQIAQELGIPKKAVKQIVKDLRGSQHIPSWWDNESYKGGEEDLAKIRALYEPTLPVPDIGVHKKIAEQLSIKPVTVYQAIKTIRAQLNLPRYNDPALHGIELQPHQSEQAGDATQAAQVTDKAEATQEQEPTPVDSQNTPPIVPASTDDISTTDTAAVVEATLHEPDNVDTPEASTSPEQPAQPEQTSEMQGVSTES